MKADVFHKWFVEWEARTKTINNESGVETRLMIYDGHLSQLTKQQLNLLEKPGLPY